MNNIKILMEEYILKIKPYLWATLWSLLVSFLLGTGWYILFTYSSDITVYNLLIDIFSGLNFWLNVGIFTVLYSIFITYPVVFFRKKKVN